MPVTKSAKKRMVASEKRRLRNKSVRTRCRSSVARAGRFIAAGDLEAARQAVTEAVSVLDRAVAKGVIHPNNAARRKARLLKKLNQAQTG